MSEFYGISHPNPDGRAGGAKRPVDDLRGGAVHVSVNAPSTRSANDVARYQSTQRVTYSGYNSLFDSDEHLRYFPDDRAPNGARGGNKYGKYNRILVHLSAACQTDTWERYVNWADLTYGFMATEVRRLHDTYDWPYRLLTKSELDRGLKGFITHARLDPDRRRDPGAQADGYGAFSFDRLFTLADAGTSRPPTPPPVIIEETDMLKHGDKGVEVRQLQHLVNAVIAHTGGWHADQSKTLIPITGTFDNATAERVQHAVWRMEGWVFGHPVYAEEEGGSRVTPLLIAYFVDCVRGLRSGAYDLNPATHVTQSGIDLKNAEAAAKFVRENAQ
jgi:hypothetical protein